MDSFIKNIAKKVYHTSENFNLGRKVITLAFSFRKLNRKFNDSTQAIRYLTTNFNKFYITNSKDDKGQQIKDLIEKLNITIPKEGFIFSLDELRNLNQKGHIIDNISIDYSRIINYSLKDYKDSKSKADGIFDLYKEKKNETPVVGDVVFFGSYEQNNDLSDGKEDIEWCVLAKEDGKMLQE